MCQNEGASWKHSIKPTRATQGRTEQHLCSCESHSFSFSHNDDLHCFYYISVKLCNLTVVAKRLKDDRSLVSCMQYCFKFHGGKLDRSLKRLIRLD